MDWRQGESTSIFPIIPVHVSSSYLLCISIPNPGIPFIILHITISNPLSPVFPEQWWLSNKYMFWVAHRHRPRVDMRSTCLPLAAQPPTRTCYVSHGQAIYNFKKNSWKAFTDKYNVPICVVSSVNQSQAPGWHRFQVPACPCNLYNLHNLVWITNVIILLNSW